MRKFSGELFLLFVLLLARVWSTPLPQDGEKVNNEEGEDEEEEEEEGEDEYYGDEEKGSSTSKPEVVKETEEELDKDDLEDAALRKELSQRLGIKNYTSSALADKATNVVLAFIASRYAKPSPKPSQNPYPKIRTTTTKSAPVAITTRKYKISRSSSTPIPREENIISENSTVEIESSKTFLITVPKDKAGTGGGIIEISIPKNLTSELNVENNEDAGNHHHLSQMSILGEDEQGVKNIEAAIMEALLLAQQMTGMTMSTVMSGDNDKEVIELDIREMPKMKSENESLPILEINATQVDMANSESPQRAEAESETQQTIQVLTESPLQGPEVTSTQKPLKLRTTPKGPKIPDPLGLGPLTDVFVSQIRNGKLPTFVWGSIVKLASSKYAQIAVDAVECAVFYYCPDDTELGTLSEGAKF